MEDMLASSFRKAFVYTLAMPWQQVLPVRSTAPEGGLLLEGLSAAGAPLLEVG